MDYICDNYRRQSAQSKFQGYITVVRVCLFFFMNIKALEKKKKFDAMLYIFQLLKCTYSKQNIDRCDTLEFKESTKIYLL